MKWSGDLENVYERLVRWTLARKQEWAINFAISPEANLFYRVCIACREAAKHRSNLKIGMKFRSSIRSTRYLETMLQCLHRRLERLKQKGCEPPSRLQAL